MISNKTLNSLSREGITIEQARVMSDNELRRIPSIGRIALEEIRNGNSGATKHRSVKQIVQAAGTLYALANDGTVWFMTDGGWRQERSLPQPEHGVANDHSCG